MMFGKEGFFATIEVIEDVFMELESGNIIQTLKENEEYQRLYEEADKIVQGNSRLEILLEQEEAVSLSKEDARDLLAYLELEHRMDDLFRMELYQYAQDKVIKQFARALDS